MRLILRDARKNALLRMRGAAPITPVRQGWNVPEAAVRIAPPSSLFIFERMNS
jgi:hypothetical protein